MREAESPCPNRTSSPRCRPNAGFWAVAAVHGESERLRRLHAALRDRLIVGDSLVYLGNFLGWGDSVFDTVQELLLFRRAFMARRGAEHDAIVFLRGRQEEMWHRLLQIQFAVSPAEVLKWMRDQGIGTTIEAYGGTVAAGLEAAARGAVALTDWTTRLRRNMRRADGHNALMSDLRRAAFNAENSVLFVSAGIDVSRPLSEQLDTFWWGQTPFDSIVEPFAGFRRIVRGLDPRRRGMRADTVAVTLDQGCGFGGPLVAACFDPEGEVVDSLEA